MSGLAMYSTANGSLHRELFEHHNMPVTCLAWNTAASLLASADATRTLQIHSLTIDRSAKIELTTRTSEVDRAKMPEFMLFSPNGRYLLLVSHGLDERLDLQDNTWKCLTPTNPDYDSADWTQHPLEEGQLILATPHVVKTIAWDTGETLTSIDYRGLGLDLGSQVSSLKLLASQQCSIVCLAYIEEPSKSVHGTVTFDVNRLSTIATTKRTVAQHEKSIPDDLIHAIGTYKNLLVFFTRGGWVCSAALDTMEKVASYTKHFWIPQKWHTMAEDLLMTVTTSGLVVLALKDELVVFHSGLDHEEKVWLGTPSTPSAKSSIRSTLQRYRSNPS